MMCICIWYEYSTHSIDEINATGCHYHYSLCGGGEGRVVVVVKLMMMVRLYHRHQFDDDGQTISPSSVW